MSNVSSESVGELLCRLAEQVANAVMNAEADQLADSLWIGRYTNFLDTTARRLRQKEAGWDSLARH